MLVSDLRELLDGYKEDDLRVLIVEMYKAMPKKLREEKDIDVLLQDVQGFMQIGKVQKRKEAQIDVYSLESEINQFVDFAYQQFYFAPNNYVHKKERPKWRFKVKAYIKDLQCVPNRDVEGKIATDLLEKLYGVLTYACGYWIFNTEDPFRSVGIVQTELIDLIYARKFVFGVTNESVRSAIALIINNGLDRETLYSYLIHTLIKYLKFPDAKIIAIEQCKQLKTELDSSKLAKKSRYSDSSDYVMREKVENLVEIVVRLNIELEEYEEAIRYYQKNNQEKNSEVSLYVLLKLLLEYELKECWLSEYNKAVAKGIKPRDALEKTHQYILENETMPEYMLY